MLPAKIYSDLVLNKNQSNYSESYIRAGFDYALTKDFTVRLGGDQNYYTAGASFDLFFLSLDYAYKSPKDETQESIYALGLRLGELVSQKHFVENMPRSKPNSIAYLEINVVINQWVFFD